MPLVWLSSDPRFLAANGQILAIRRARYEETGGYSTVRSEVVDDMALCRLVKTSGGRVVFADGHHMAECRMYHSAREVWEGFSKNLFEGIGGRFIALLFVFGLYGVTFLLPYLGLVASLLVPDLLLPALAGVAANVLVRVVLAVRHAQPPEGILLHPVSILGFFAIAWNSYRWNAAGRITWAGRVYTARAGRAEAKAEEVTHG
jgi:chlorobactene glucosyltransferase